MNPVKQLCKDYIEGFGHPNTKLCYHHRLDGPRGIAALSSPEDVAKRQVRGKPMPYGYGSGIQDVPLENGQFLFALCDAYDATGDDDLAALARRVFQGMKLVATVSPEPGFVPRGPHPDGKSYYTDSSRDQTCAFVEAMWRYSASSLATADDRAFISDSLAKVARRMEKNDYVLMVEDGSHMAHVGWGWKQHTVIGAATLLGHLAAVKDATGDPHWGALYDRFGREKDAVRWHLLSVASANTWQPETLYSNQFFTSLAVLARTESDPARATLVGELMKTQAERALRSNVFDLRDWRRLDWAGDWSDEETQAALGPFGLTLAANTTVIDLYEKFDPRLFRAQSPREYRVNAKLLMGIPTVALHKALLSEDPALVREAGPYVKDMVDKMLEHGDGYTHGENFNRAVILGLHLVALGAEGSSH
ncbi:MAG TPA: hypothetical protein VMY37_24050 [Thermoguttaceae bacterium]|nr:hypothetical protein [Thermoguttaceae bacterium]